MASHTFCRARVLNQKPCSAADALVIVNDILSNGSLSLADDLRVNLRNVSTQLDVLKEFPGEQEAGRAAERREPAATTPGVATATPGSALPSKKKDKERDRKDAKKGEDAAKEGKEGKKERRKERRKEGGGKEGKKEGKKGKEEGKDATRKRAAEEAVEGGKDTVRKPKRRKVEA